MPKRSLGSTPQLIQKDYHRLDAFIYDSHSFRNPYSNHRHTFMKRLLNRPESCRMQPQPCWLELIFRDRNTFRMTWQGPSPARSILVEIMIRLIRTNSSFWLPRWHKRGKFHRSLIHHKSLNFVISDFKRRRSSAWLLRRCWLLLLGVDKLSVVVHPSGRTPIWFMEGKTFWTSFNNVMRWSLQPTTLLLCLWYPVLEEVICILKHTSTNTPRSQPGFYNDRSSPRLGMMHF